MLRVLTETANFFAEQQAQVYLVGGSLRDLLFEEPCVDWDLVTDGEAHTLARLLANRLGGSYAYLHEKASRVVLCPEQTATQHIFDISPLYGRSLEEDLRTRDFTLNALAAPLTDVVKYLNGSETGIYHFLIDPLYGHADLQNRLLRVVDADTFRRDPLRMLRALRLAKRFKLTLAAQTKTLLQRDCSLLTRVAVERIHQEIYSVLSTQGALDWLHELDTYGLLTTLIPEMQAARALRQPPPHYWDVLEHSLQSVAALETLTAALQDPTDIAGEELGELRALLYDGEQQGIFHFAELQAPRMKLAALLHDIGKPQTHTIDVRGDIHFYGHPQLGAPIASEIMRRLSASTQDRRLAQMVAAHHMRPGQLGQDSVVTPRAIRRYFVDLGPIGILVALFSLADHLATLGPQPRVQAWTRHLSVVRLLLTGYIREREKILPPRLVHSEELMSRLKLQPGPILGQLLDLIAEAQAEGTIHSREEAILLAREYVHTRKQEHL
ncbi:MAG TPA: HD domain-containing protein [Ktedonobacteraceae bacterium]|jgi:putative nucleotidyltransferase with HDIG domain